VTLRLVVASANPDKAQEIADILCTALGDGVELVARPGDVPDVDETGDTLEDNARLKAVALRDATGLAAIADDSGLEVDALDGRPGVHSARYSGPGATYASNVEKLLGELEGVPDARRGAQFRAVVMVVFPDGREVSAEGVVRGRIIDAPRGDGGFGYDPVFVPDEDPEGRTFGEMGDGFKHSISHRGRAVRAVAAQLAALR
jgi:XTP/dITP diphosphohydrolase